MHSLKGRIDDEQNGRCNVPKLKSYWEIHPLCPRDFPPPSGNLLGMEDGFPNTSLVLIHCSGHLEVLECPLTSLLSVFQSTKVFLISLPKTGCTMSGGGLKKHRRCSSIDCQCTAAMAKVHCMLILQLTTQCGLGNLTNCLPAINCWEVLLKNKLGQFWICLHDDLDHLDEDLKNQF